MVTYNSIHGIEVDLIGYVRTEKSRINRMRESGGGSDMFIQKAFPIEMFDDEYCFEIVKKHLGWYPAIYDIKWNNKGFLKWLKENMYRFDANLQKSISNKIKKGERVFKHNNCLPCKNMNIIDIICVEYFFPEYMSKAKELSNKLKAYWGRSETEYYTTFGKEDYEVKQCEICSFD